MIRTISIKNYAIIRNVELDFAPGLNIITGETGAGKSIILGALGLVMGDRADYKVSFDRKKKCVIEAQFSISEYHLKDFFDRHDLDYDADTLILRREIYPAGRSRSFINDTPVTLHNLREISGGLVDLHRQFTSLDLHHRTFQEEMLDSYAESLTESVLYREKRKELLRLEAELAEMIEAEKEARQEEDYITFQLKELQEMSLEENEENALEERLQSLEHGDDIRDATAQAWEQLKNDDHSIVSQLRSLTSVLDKVSAYDQQIEETAARLKSCLIELDDIGESCLQINEQIVSDPLQTEEVRERLNQINRLLHKHGLVTSGDLLELEERMMARLSTRQDLSDRIESWKEKRDLAEQACKLHAERLRKQRKKAIPTFESEVGRLLARLDMQRARFIVSLQEVEEFLPNGMDTIDFLFTANPGSAPGKIKDVASGGELSRLTLCIKSLVADKVALPTMIYDEIDTGVSGPTAQKMGKILQQMGRDHQIVMITHSAHIAALADLHFYVSKKELDGIVHTSVVELEQRERIRKIATMLSSDPPTQAAMENAKELMSIN